MSGLHVIEGGASGVQPWLNFPSRVRARSPFDKDQLAWVRLASEFPIKAARAARRQPAFELWSCLLKTPPPINNIGYAGNQPTHEGLTALSEAHACFKGLKRPLAEDDVGGEVLTYVLNPFFFYRFDSQYQGAMVCLGRRLPVADDLLFLAHVRLDQPCGSGDEPVLGALTHWGFVEKAGDGAGLPAGYDTRFQDRLW